MPFNELNIDKSLSGEAARREELKRVLSSVVSMAHILELQVCVKGIEDREALDYARFLNCEMAQGFFIGHPTTAGKVAAGILSREIVPQSAPDGCDVRRADRHAGGPRLLPVGVP